MMLFICDNLALLNILHAKKHQLVHLVLFNSYKGPNPGVSAVVGFLTREVNLSKSKYSP